MANGIAKIQHYVPQFLPVTCIWKEDRVHVFDKHFDRVFVSNVKNIKLVRVGIMTFELDGHDLTIEPALGEIESSAKPIIVKDLGSDTPANYHPRILVHYQFF